MKQPRIIVVGASAGGVEALVRMVGGFTMDHRAATFIVLHIPASPPSLLPGILTRKGTHLAVHPKDDEIVEAGKIYIAPPDYHMTFTDGRIHLARGPRVNRHRPSIDELFCSAAATYGGRVIGVILSGSMNDGAVGMAAIQKAGGTVIVQDPEDALVPSMPESAIAAARPDYIVHSNELGPLLSRLVQQDGANNGAKDGANHGGADGATLDPPSRHSAMELKEKIQNDLAHEENHSRNGEHSVLTCPECGGVLWEQKEGGIVNFACHQGHKLTAESLVDGQSLKIEEALWTAVRLMKEKAVLCRKLAARMSEKGSGRSAQNFMRSAESLEQHLVVLRNTLIHDESLELNELASETL